MTTGAVSTQARQLHAYVLIRARHGAVTSVRSAIRAVPGLSEADCLMEGVYDVVGTIAAGDRGDLAKILSTIRDVPGVERAEICISLIDLRDQTAGAR